MTRMRAAAIAAAAAVAIALAGCGGSGGGDSTVAGDLQHLLDTQAASGNHVVLCVKQSSNQYQCKVRTPAGGTAIVSVTDDGSNISEQGIPARS